jgi:hypothetical protein
VRQIYRVHHPEDQGDAHGEKEQHQTELNAVERLLDQ